MPTIKETDSKIEVLIFNTTNRENYKRSFAKYV